MFIGVCIISMCCVCCYVLLYVVLSLVCVLICVSVCVLACMLVWTGVCCGVYGLVLVLYSSIHHTIRVGVCSDFFNHVFTLA